MGVFGKITGWTNSKQQVGKPPGKRSVDEGDGAPKRQKRRHPGPGSGGDSDSDESGDFEVLTDPNGFRGENGDDGFPTRNDSDGDTEMGGDSDGFSAMSYEAEDPTAARESMQQQFRSPRGIVFQRVIGQGQNAIAALLHDNRVNPPRRLILKRPLRDDDISFIVNEIKVLKELRGAAHSVQILNGADAVFDDPKMPGASIALEYVENGSFARLLERCNEAKARVPNRVLWSIMLCLIRACVGLTWPPRGKARGSEKLETVPRKGKPTPYAHNDLHVDNIMFGNMSPDLAEHCMFPPVKLIDFGQASDTQSSKGPPDEQNRNPYQGEHSNSYKLAEAMMRLIAGTKPMEILPTFQKRPAHLSGVETHATLLWAYDEDGDERYPKLDRPLRRLIGRMMACNYKDRPLLEDILDTASEAVRHRTEQDYPGFEAEETDEAVAAFVDRFFFSPPAPGASGEGGLLTPPDSSP